ncbi:unnamed protein product [Cyclocybe aegerita]|uniref:Uncharacterized protein n=1 Tax=Cyclocybe aegerita TaxID=1973307 RepID=A0A8S0XXJ2_CYCAE|nr:unnamed protein product [Cyclocybe aegerita]
MSSTRSTRPNIDHFYKSERIELEESTVEAHDQVTPWPSIAGNGSISFGEEAKGSSAFGSGFGSESSSSWRALDAIERGADEPHLADPVHHGPNYYTPGPQYPSPSGAPYMSGPTSPFPQFGHMPHPGHNPYGSPNGYMNGGWPGQSPYPPPPTWGGPHPSRAPAQMPRGNNQTSPTPSRRGPSASNQTLGVPRRDWDNDSIQETASNASSDDEREENTGMENRPDQPLTNASSTTSTTATLDIRGQSSSTGTSSFSMSVGRTTKRR